MEEVGLGSDEDWLGKTGTEMELREDRERESDDALRVDDAGEICTEPQMRVGEERGACKVRAKYQGPQMAAKGIQSSMCRHLSQGMGTE